MATADGTLEMFPVELREIELELPRVPAHDADRAEDLRSMVDELFDDAFQIVQRSGHDASLGSDDRLVIRGRELLAPLPEIVRVVVGVGPDEQRPDATAGGALFEVQCGFVRDLREPVHRVEVPAVHDGMEHARYAWTQARLDPFDRPA